MAVRRSSTVRKVAKAPRPIRVAKITPVAEPEIVAPAAEGQLVQADIEFELSADEVAASIVSWPARQTFIGGPRDGQGAEVADHVEELRLGAGGVYRRDANGNFEWVTPA